MLNRVFAAVLLFGSVWAGLSAQEQKFGGSYEQLRPEQQKLVNDWISEYQKITGTKREAATSYNNLPLSYRTTFDAVTHALLQSKLTAEDGSSLGNGLDIIQLVEAAHGQVAGARGDHQYRIYILLKPDGLDRLYKAREFKRTHDNTVYHHGYPINFRQQGGTPSIQVSVTRTGRRADIDVDYRSSGGPQALLNGHLSSANSDVRAGANYSKHNARWDGFENWWKNLFGMLAPPPKEEITVALDAAIPAKPRIKDSEPVEEAVNDLFQSWFVEAKPEVAASYLAVKSYACLAEFQSGERLENGLALLRILQHMRLELVAYGKTASLSDTIESAPFGAPGAKPVRQKYERLFHIEQLHDDVAQSMDCRVRQNTDLAMPLPKVSHKLGDNYVSTVRLLKQKGLPTNLSLIWTKDEGRWKVISWHLEHPLREAVTPKVAEREKSQAIKDSGPAVDPRLVKATDGFFTSWLIARQYAQAAAILMPQTSQCKAIQDASGASALLESIASQLPKKDKLSDLITSVEHSHPHLREVNHPLAKAFLLARVSDDLAAMSECSAGVPDRAATEGKPTFKTNTYQTIFRLKGTQGVAGALTMQWALRGDQWMIFAVAINND